MKFCGLKELWTEWVNPVLSSIKRALCWVKISMSVWISRQLLSMCINNDNYAVKLYYFCCCCSGSRENGLKPVLARQSKYSVGQANGQTTSQPERFVSPSSQPSSPQIPSPLAPLVPSSPLLQRQQLDATLPLLVSSPHSQPLHGEFWCQRLTQVCSCILRNILEVYYQQPLSLKYNYLKVWNK